MIRLAAVWLCLVLLACGGSSGAKRAPMPLRAPTAGQGLLGSAPIGADMLLELDLRRLRDNPVVGSLLTSAASPDNSETVDLVRQAEVALLCIYDIGGVPKQLVILRSEEDSLAGAVALGKNLFAVGDDKLLTLAAGIQGPKDSMLADLELLRLRDTVMPAAAKNAAFRVSLRLDFDARVAIASKVQISDVPISVAVWGDVVDDMAFIAHLGSDEVEDAPRLERAIVGFRKRLAAHPFARRLGLSTPIRDAQVSRVDKMVQVVVLLGPKRLQYVVNMLLKQLSKAES